MCEEEKVETTEAPRAEATAWDNVLKETVKVFESLGKAIVTTAQSASHMLLVEVDKDTCDQLDLLVQNGVAKSRQEAAAVLIVEGLKSRNAVFDRIQKTNTEIAALRQQIRTLVTG